MSDILIFYTLLNSCLWFRYKYLFSGN